MGMRLSFNNFFSFISYITPFLVTFYILSIGLMQGGLGIVKSIVYLAGILVVFIASVLIQNQIKELGPIPANPLCGVFDLGTNFVNPSISTSVISFSLFYLIFSMSHSGDWKFGLLGFLTLLLIGDMITRVMRQCSKPMGIAFGLIVGLGVAYLFKLGVSFGDEKLLYFGNIASNNVTCSKATNQTFKCAVYKNGQIIKNL